MRLPKSRWARVVGSLVVVSVVAGITLGATTLLGVTFQGSGEGQPVEGALSSRQPGVAICVEAVDAEGDAKASIEADAKSRVEEAMTEVATHPDWELVGLGNGPTVVDLSCPSPPAPPVIADYPAPIEAIWGHKVSEPSKYRLFVFVLPPQALMDLVGGSTTRRAVQETMNEGHVFWEVTAAVYFSPEELQDTPSLVRTLEDGLPLRSRSDQRAVATPTAPLPTELSLLAEGNGEGLDSATAKRVVNARNPFPDLVATVNGQEISGIALARKMEIFRINYEDAGGGVPDEGQLITEALDDLIENELLAQAASERGLWPSEDEVVAQAQNMKEIILELPPTSPQREAAETLLREQEFDISELDSDPVILREIERGLAIARITFDVQATPLPGQSLDIDAVRAAIKELVDSLRSEADIAIYVSATAE